MYSMLNLVVVSCIMLIHDEPLKMHDDEHQQIFIITDSVISFIFMAEAILLIFVFGVWNKNGNGYF